MNKNFFFGLIVGAAVGAAVGLLYTPRPGIEMRGEIAGRTRQAGKRIGDLAHTVAEKASGVEERIKQAI